VFPGKHSAINLATVCAHDQLTDRRRDKSEPREEGIQRVLICVLFLCNLGGVRIWLYLGERHLLKGDDRWVHALEEIHGARLLQCRHSLLDCLHHIYNHSVKILGEYLLSYVLLSDPPN